MDSQTSVRVARRFTTRLAVKRRSSSATISDMASVVAARHAKEVLKEQLGRPPWRRGIGIGGERGNYCVKGDVRAATEEVRAAIPGTVEGVEVIVDEVGDIRPHRR